MITTKIIDAEWEEIDEADQVAIAPVPKKRIGKIVFQTIKEIILLVGFSLVVSRILGYWIYGI